MFSTLVFSWFLTFGLVPGIGDSLYNEYVLKQDATVAQIGVAISTANNKFTFHTDIENFQMYEPKGNSILRFSPFRVNYGIGLDYRPVDGIKLSIYHQCDHPVVTYNNVIPVYPYNSSITKVTCTIYGKGSLSF